MNNTTFRFNKCQKTVFQFNSKNVDRETEQLLSPPNQFKFGDEPQRPAWHND